MEINYNARQIREQVSPVDLLAALGHHPAYRSGKELFYSSMLRKERTPSFCVDEKLGVWYDHGGANHSGITGGNVIDLGLAYWYPMPFSQVLEKISDACSRKLLRGIVGPAIKANRPENPVKIPHYHIGQIKALGSNPAIQAYLQKRGVWPVAGELVREIYYFIDDGKTNRKHFFSAGWQNENGGWEVNNPYFKGCLGPKGLTLIPRDNSRLAVFEGAMDYLSWKGMLKDHTHSVLILNGVTLVGAAIKKASAYREVAVFFDRDEAGRNATQTLRQAIPYAQDCSDHYKGYKDYNEKLVAQLSALNRFKPENGTGILNNSKSRYSR